MNVLVVGASQTGYHLIRLLLSSGSNVGLIDMDESKCEHLHHSMNLLTIHGDGRDESILRTAMIGKTDWVIALTGNDGDNLAICQIAIKAFPGIQTATIVKNPTNEPLFRRLGITKVMNPALSIHKMIKGE